MLLLWLGLGLLLRLFRVTVKTTVTVMDRVRVTMMTGVRITVMARVRVTMKAGLRLL